MTGDTSLAALKPCPFCGESQAMLCDSPCGWNDSGKAWAVSCRTEDCHGAIFSLGYDLFETQAEAIAAWNTRTADQRCAELEAENARLRGRLDMLQMREAAYRSAHDLHGDGSMKAGSAWDALRRAGDEARKALENRDD